jgi:hypothetical protein
MSADKIIITLIVADGHKDRALQQISNDGQSITLPENIAKPVQAENRCCLWVKILKKTLRKTRTI